MLRRQRVKELCLIARAEPGRIERSTGRVARIEYCCCCWHCRTVSHQKTVVGHCCPDCRIMTWLFVSERHAANAREEELGALQQRRTRFLFAATGSSVGVAGCWSVCTNRLLPSALTVDFQLHTGTPIQRTEPASRQLHSIHHVGPSAKVRIHLFAQDSVLTCAQIQPAHADRHHTSTRRHPQGPRSRCQFRSSSLGLILHWRKMQDIQRRLHDVQGRGQRKGRA